LKTFQERTEVISEEAATTNAVIDFISNATSGWCDCGDSNMPSIAIAVSQINQAITDARRKGLKLRYITDITDKNLPYCKKLMELVELRHLDNVKANFAVSDTHYMAATVLAEKTPVPQVIYSNVKTLVAQQQYIFDSLWDKAIPAEQRIEEIERQIERPLLEVIRMPEKAIQKYLSLTRSAKEEVFLILPTADSFQRDKRIGVIAALVDAAKNGIKVRILSPIDEKTGQSLEELKEQGITIRLSPSSNRALFTLLIVDRKYSFTINTNDDFPTNFNKAFATAVFSNRADTVEPLVSIFENLWMQIDFYHKLEETNKELSDSTEELKMAFEALADMNRRILKANKDLKVHDKMQSEFINIAAHELRTPVQPLLGLADVLYSKFEGADQERLEVSKSDIEIIMRNAKRLERLSSDILDVSRIEAQSLRLYRESFDLNSKIKDVISDTHSFMLNKSNVEIVFLPSSSAPLLVDGDKAKIFQVVSNMLVNAIKFTEEGTITVTTRKSEDNRYAIVSITDTGTGINPQVLPRLFTKFTVAQIDNLYDTRTGSGLGLFISKNIVDAHGGKIWAENNESGRGATFSFTLPLSR
jgi:two-component system, OmpR family, sensor histidine kinase VicK